MRTLSVVIIMGLFVVTVPTAKAQYFKFDNMTPEQVANGTPERQIGAILDFFGAIVGNGLYHTADLHSVGGIDVGLRGVVANVPDEFEGLPVFIDENRIGLAFLHGSVGLPGPFELLGRFFYFPIGADVDANLSPPRAQDSRGGVTLIGGGLKYGLLQMPGVPKVTVLGAYHALITPDEFDFGTVGTFSIEGIISHSLPILTVYVGAGVDITNLKVNDDLPLPLPDIEGKRFTETQFQYTGGVKVQVLPLIFANASANFGEFNSFDVGLGLTLR